MMEIQKFYPQMREKLLQSIKKTNRMSRLSRRFYHDFEVETPHSAPHLYLHGLFEEVKTVEDQRAFVAAAKDMKIFNEDVIKALQEYVGVNELKKRFKDKLKKPKAKKKVVAVPASDTDSDE